LAARAAIVRLIDEDRIAFNIPDFEERFDGLD
jgi:hypothetical protein